MQSYLNEVSTRYNPHFRIFAAATDGTDDFEDWQAILSVKGKAGMEAKATAQLAALVLNIMSLKVGQYEVVTADGQTAGDVMSYVSELIEDGDGSNDQLAKDLAEDVNLQQTIAAGLVNPTQAILYKDGSGDVLDEITSGIPKTYALEQNHPNPFNPSTTITFGVPEASEVTLAIYNMRGQLIQTLHSGFIDAGQHNVVWNGNDSRGAKVASGVYVYRLESKGFVLSKKLMLMK